MMPKERRWYVIYTRPRFEKKVMELLTKKGVETFVPLIKTVRQWSDRRKKVEVPLINSYVFVHIGHDLYYDVLNTHGVVKFIRFEGEPASVPQMQIDLLKYIVSDTESIDPEINPRDWKKGIPVRIKRGPFAGIEGKLIDVKGRHRVMVNLDHIEKSVTLTLSSSSLEKMN